MVEHNVEVEPSLAEELNKTLDEYWSIAVRRRWWLLLPACLVALATVGVSLVLPDVYRSETVILVEHQQVPEHYVIPNVSSDLPSRVQTLSQQVLSRMRLLQVINEFGLYREERAELVPEDLVKLMRDNIEIELVEDRRRREVNAFKLAFLAEDPQLAQQVTGRLTSLFIEENLRAREKQSKQTTAFLETELEGARRELQKQEERMGEFKRKYLGQLPEQQDTNMQVLSGLQMQLQSISAALNRAREQRVYLESLLSQYQSLADASGTGTGPLMPPDIIVAKDELARLRRQRSALLARYTPQHPDIARIDEEIKEAETLLVELREEYQSEAKEDSEESNSLPGAGQTATAIAQVQSQLESNQTEIKHLLAEEKRLQAEVREYQQRLNLTPLREQQLADIVRNYNLSKAQYEELLKKKMESEVATSLEERQQGEQFRVIDPPSLPGKPHRPDRVRFNLVGGVFGIGLAVGLAFLIEVRDRSVHSLKQMNRLVPVALAVDIPRLLTPKEEGRGRLRHWSQWVAGSLLVLAVAAAEAFVFLRG